MVPPATHQPSSHLLVKESRETPAQLQAQHPVVDHSTSCSHSDQLLPDVKKANTASACPSLFLQLGWKSELSTKQLVKLSEPAEVQGDSWPGVDGSREEKTHKATHSLDSLVAPRLAHSSES